MYGQDDGYADIAMWCVVAFGDERGVRGPSCYHDPIPVGEGYRVGKNLGWWAESMNNGAEAHWAWQKGSLHRRENPFV